MRSGPQVRANFGQFNSCKNIIDDIVLNLRRNERDTSCDSAGTQNLAISIDEIASEMNNMFGGIMQRHRQTEEIRGMVGTLRRLRWLLSAPGRVRVELQRGDVQAALRQFRLATKSLSAAKSPVLQRLMDEVQAEMQGLHEQLLRDLRSAHVTPREAEKIIHHLHLLQEATQGTMADKPKEEAAGGAAAERSSGQEAAAGTPADELTPAWQYLQMQAHGVEVELQRLVEAHTGKIRMAMMQAKQKQEAEARWSAISTDNGTAAAPSEEQEAAHLSPEAPREPWEAAEGQLQDLDRELVRELTELLLERLPELLRLGHQIVSGNFAGGAGPNKTAADADDLATGVVRVYVRCVREGLGMQRPPAGLEEEPAAMAGNDERAAAGEAGGRGVKRVRPSERVCHDLEKPWSADSCAVVKHVAAATMALAEAEGGKKLLALMQALREEMSEQQVHGVASQLSAALVAIPREQHMRPAPRTAVAAAALVLHATREAPTPAMCRGVSEGCVQATKLLAQALQQVEAVLKARGGAAAEGDALSRAIRQLHEPICALLTELRDIAQQRSEVVWLPARTGLLRWGATGETPPPSACVLGLIASCEYLRREVVPRLRLRVESLLPPAQPLPDATHVRRLFTPLEAERDSAAAGPSGVEAAAPSEAKHLDHELRALEKVIQKLYVEHQVRVLKPTIEAYANDLLGLPARSKPLASVQWRGPKLTSDKVTRVRESLLQLMHGVVTVHAEIVTVRQSACASLLPPLVQQVVTHLLGCQQRSSLNQQVSKANTTSTADVTSHMASTRRQYAQGILELAYMQRVLDSYITPSARTSLESLRAGLLPVAADSEEDQLLKLFAKRTTEELLESELHMSCWIGIDGCR
ncbi:hypothetical protein CYMTET_14206 [Cymbomonas tetramitiformis]|uniref:Exocyst complex component SEC5 n=1 Tax=Cymbomonas tetramitiformis TaxID=36881 RepID=A0AAE0GGV4_9CHLO|nr:hypothetical protein CYMTET_14206 [Cymbomonas tetramitiformis]